MNESRLIIPEDASPQLIDILEKISKMNKLEFYKFAEYCMQTNREVLIKNVAAIAIEDGYESIALELAKKALEITKRPTEIYNLIGNAYFHAGEFDKAYDAFNNALSSMSGGMNVMRASILKNIASCLMEQDNYFAAQCKLHDAIQLIMASDEYKADNNIPELYVIYAILGDAYCQSAHFRKEHTDEIISVDEDYKFAIKYLKESIHPCLPPEDIVISYYNLACVCEEIGLYEDALLNYKVALNTYNDVRDNSIIDPQLIIDAVSKMEKKTEGVK